MPELDFRKSYAALVARLKDEHDLKKAMSLSVGGDYEAIGMLEAALLLQHGLRDGQHLVDVGCGSGRLAWALAQKRELGNLRYLGTDVVPDLLDYAVKIIARPAWRFVETPGLVIPESDAQADFVCFFSVFTHLLHEQSYAYLLEARRVLKPGGRVVFSFLDYRLPEHWPVFEENLASLEGANHLNIFIGTDAIEAWAAHAGFRIDEVRCGRELAIRLPEPVVFEDGRRYETTGTLGQSFCVLTRR
jgi:SAM-dependent methyltransferase